MLEIVVLGRLAAHVGRRLAPLVQGEHAIHIFADPAAADSAAVERADVIVGWPLPGALIESARRLRLVQAAGAGFDGVPLDRLPPGAVVANTFHHEISIAEFVMLAMLYLTRRPHHYDARLRQGRWEGSCIWGEPPVLAELDGGTILLIGRGHIGRQVQRRARAFGMRVLAVGRSDAGSWRQSLPEADFVVPCCPLTADTEGLIGAPEFARMKPSAYLINTSRGKVVDEEALFEALRDRRIAGAAIDVWYQYPGSEQDACLPSRFPFHELPNVLLSPHISGWTSRTVEGRARDIADNINRLAAGQPLRNVVWPPAASSMLPSS